MNKTVAVAIDGPAGAGKSTIARRLAKSLNYIYVDTGALYRTVALSVMQSKVDSDDVSAVVFHLNRISVDITYKGDEQRVLLDGNDVSDLIRTPEVSMMASKTSAIPEVRAFLLGLQRKLAEEHNVVMDGRDIATVVLPDAKVKIFLTASPEVRAKRRYDELIQKGEKVEFSDVLADLIQRDEQDMNRPVAPLKPSEQSVIVDTSELDLEQAVAAMKSVVDSVILGDN
ncbi:MAG: (d)CMP kinase [Clostridia bacterium]|nr:(d)CMP kinase [Clostridia bacterium]